eukprot:TRINITY_DN58_c0_g3_i8.p1 TRINITY_DN58_c0_g3~~TRINITY_DN58_c0_g3_i8.p1  ORF type:complete len:179 (+),score=32.74 TRINITY_DN58_c0_g3_i8:115-651(+)
MIYFFFFFFFLMIRRPPRSTQSRSSAASDVYKRQLPVHLCRFGVRSIMMELFPGTGSQQVQSNKDPQFTPFVTTIRLRNINLIPIDYGFRPRLRGRLTLRRLALRRNPWTFDVSVSHTHLATHVSILTSDTSRQSRDYPSQAYGTLRYHSTQRVESAASVHGFSPGTSSAQAGLNLDQ